jgi:hypothetical protein
MDSRFDTGSTRASEDTLWLNVILHGLFAFDQEKEIIAYIPDMGSEHLYKAGSWLAETNLGEHADLKLEGVRKGPPRKNRILPDHNIILGNVPASTTAHECHCIRATLHLPYPTSPVRSLRRLKVPAGALGGDDKGRIVAKRDVLESATVQVLTYELLNSEDDLKLGNHPWEPVLQGKFVNLHVFSEPERNVTDDHVRHAFQAGIGVFAGVDLTLTGRVQPSDEDEELPPGVNELELQDLVQRQRWLAVLGRAIKEGRDVNYIWGDPTAFAGSDGCTGCVASIS